MADATIDGLPTIAAVDRATDMLAIWDTSDSLTGEATINATLGLSSAPLGTSDSQSPTNKTFDNTNTIVARDDRFTLQDNSDTTKQAQFQLSGITTATTRTYTLPNASSTLVDLSTVQTLTNKTFTSPVINTATIANPTLTVDAISEFTAAAGVTIDGMLIKDGTVGPGTITPAGLASGTGSSWALQSYVPAFTNFSLGNGTLNYAKYIQVGKNVDMHLKVTLGSTSTITGAIIISLPVNMHSDYTSDSDAILQTVRILDSGTAFYEGWAVWASASTIKLNAKTAGGTYVSDTAISNTVPMTWTTNDAFMVSIRYRVA